jgi:hypothetical protein
MSNSYSIERDDNVCSGATTMVQKETAGTGGAANPEIEKSIGFLHNCHMGNRENVRLEFRAMFMLSVLAMGRKVLNISARLNAGRGDVEEGVGVDDAMLPAEDRRVISATRLARHQTTTMYLQRR